MLENSFNKFVFLPLLCFSICFLLLLLPYNNLQFIGLASFPFLLFIGALLTKRKLIIEIKYVDLFWILFIVLGFVSYFWATNGSLVWYRGFSFLALLMISLTFRDLIKYPFVRKFFPVLMSILFLIIFLQHLMAVHLEMAFLDASWINYLSRNSNVTTCYLVSFFPFLLFKQSKNQFYRFVKILSAILILNILFLANVKIVILSFLLIMLYYFWSNQRKLLFVLFAMAVFGLIIVNGFFNYDELMSKYFADIYRPDSFSRMSLVELSFDLIKDNLLIGVGQGNWIIEVYNNNLSQFASLDSEDSFTRYHSHNLYLKIASELGVIGLVLFLAPFLIMIYRGIKQVSTFDYLDKACFATVLCYLMISAYYGGINLYEYNFSGVEVLAFICMGILSRKLYRKSKAVNYYYLLPIVIVSVTWFLYSATSWHNIHTVLNHSKDMTALEKANSIKHCYSPSFLNCYGFNAPLDLKIAELYSSSGETEKAIVHYNRMINVFPYHCGGLLSYSKFLIANNIEKDLSIHLLEKILSIQGNHREAKNIYTELISQ